MVVKYYGQPRRLQNELTRKWEVIDFASIWAFCKMTTEELHDTFPNPSQCIWLVPGTFDMEGNHVW